MTTSRWSLSRLRGIDTLRAYRREWIRADVLAGVTVAAYLVPQVMAYGKVAGVAPVAGLWAATAALLVYAMLGSSRQLSVGPESTTALLTATTIAPLAAGDATRYAALAVALAALAGIWCLVARLGRLGFLADLLSGPVMVGYLAGTALTMIVSQSSALTGLPSDGHSVHRQIGALVRNMDQVHAPTILLSLSVLVVLFYGGHRFPTLPISLLAVLLATAATVLFSLQRMGVAVVGEVPSAMPPMSVPAVSSSDLAVLCLPAAGIALVGYTDNVLTARSFAARNGRTIDANTELTALGAANVAAAFAHGFPVSSSASRTAIGNAVGSRTQVHSIVAVVAVGAVLVAGRDLLAAFPTAALGALVVYAATLLIDVPEFRRIARFRRSEFVIAIATTASVLIAGVLYGVIIAVGLSVVDLLRRVARPHDAILGYTDDIEGMHDVDDYPDAQVLEGLVVYRYDAPLCFANADDFHHRASDAATTASTTTEWFVLDAEAIFEIDLTALDGLVALRDEFATEQIAFALARVKQDLRTDLNAMGFIDELGPNRTFATLPAAVSAYTTEFIKRHGRPPRRRQ
ncbi:SulP family inorganic anion transporter [Tsukamurella tyrosinosolvens]|uniref:SulP family inorganic anion transporter n=1 Tax=Tsukamurella tyrosinosolvens TaxID=57704 RepID=UPI000CA30B75|nr:sulfate permease [Tsukamurella tyrosinosolvens]AUN41827.1 sodium-independent anion transporter [Tsukamurella tyrosinosolvens]